MVENIASWILFLPLIAAGLITLFTRRNPAVSAQISIAAVALSFFLSLLVFAKLGQHASIAVPPIQWLAVGNLNVELTFENMDDFSPASVARKVDALGKLLEAREQLANLITYMDGKTGAEDLVAKLLQDPALLQTLATTKNTPEA